MKKIRSIAVLLFVLCAMVVVLTACGGTTDTNNNTSVNIEKIVKAEHVSVLTGYYDLPEQNAYHIPRYRDYFRIWYDESYFLKDITFAVYDKDEGEYYFGAIIASTGYGVQLGGGNKPIIPNSYIYIFPDKEEEAELRGLDEVVIKVSWDYNIEVSVTTSEILDTYTVKLNYVDVDINDYIRK